MGRRAIPQSEPSRIFKFEIGVPSRPPEIFSMKKARRFAPPHNDPVKQIDIICSEGHKVPENVAADTPRCSVCFYAPVSRSARYCGRLSPAGHLFPNNLNVLFGVPPQSIKARKQ